MASLKAETPMFVSQDGSRAYGIAAAEYTAAGCRHTTTVFVAEPGGTFRALFQQESETRPDGTVLDGNGIGAIRWSPSGVRLLVDITQWISGSDSTFDTKYVLVTFGDAQAKQVPLSFALGKQFNDQCYWKIKSIGWIDDTQIRVTVIPSSMTDEDGSPDPTPSCVQQPTDFKLDVVTGALQLSSQ